MDGDAEAEDGGDAEPSLAAPEDHHGSSIVWLCGNDRHRAAGALETVVPLGPVESAVIPLMLLPWGGRGNIVAAADAAPFESVAGRRCRSRSESVRSDRAIAGS